MTTSTANSWKRILSRKLPLLAYLTLLVSLCFSLGCSKSPDAKYTADTPPAKVEKIPSETEIGRITLTEQSQHRLGIAFDEIKEQDVQRKRTFGGDVMIPSGKSVIVSAPFAGTIATPANTTLPLPGEQLTIGQPILQLNPLLTPERDVPTPAEQVQMANARAMLSAAVTTAQGDVQRSTAEVAAAHVTLERAQQLLSDRVGTRRAVEDAEGQLNIAQSTLDAAAEREKQLLRLVEELDKPATARTAEPLVLVAPQSGLLRSLSVSPGQAVTPGAALFEVVDTSTMWIRVPVYVQLLSKINVDADAQVVSLGSLSSATSSNGSAQTRETSQVLIAEPVAAPPSADPLSSTVDLYFAIANETAKLRPGQRIGMQLALEGQQTGRTVAAESILYDIYGGTWVYVQVDEHVFERRRVLISHMLDGRAVLAEGPVAGTKAVTAGAAELFGTEFGVGK